MTDTRPTGDTPGERPPRPQLVLVAVGLFVLTALGAILGPLVLRLNRAAFTTYVQTSSARNHTKLPADLPKAISSYFTNQLIEGIVFAVLLLLVARLALMGRHFSRWAALLLFLLATISTPYGFGGITSVAANAPGFVKAPGFLTSLCFLVATGLLFLKPVSEWLLWGRPAPAAGRGGLFGPGPARSGTAGAAGRGGGLFGRPAPARDTVVDARPVKVETTPARPGAKGRGSTSVTAPAAGKPSANRPAARGKGSAKSRRS